MEDHSHDYLLPSCMSRRQSYSKANLFPVKQEVSNHLNFNDVFDKSLKVLESDTCSDFSDLSYMDARNYLHAKHGESPFLEQQFSMDIEEYKPPWERNNQSRFDQSLQHFLQWPNNNKDMLNGDEDLSAVSCKTEMKNRFIGKKKKLYKVRGNGKNGKVMPQFETLRKREKWPVGRHSARDLSRNMKTHSICSLKRAVKAEDVESDSDYRTYSDTSSEWLDTTSLTTHDNGSADVDSFQSLMTSVFEKADHLSNKLHDNVRKTRNHSFCDTPKRSSSISSSSYRQGIETQREIACTKDYLADSPEKQRCSKGKQILPTNGTSIFEGKVNDTASDTSLLSDLEMAGDIVISEAEDSARTNNLNMPEIGFRQFDDSDEVPVGNRISSEENDSDSSTSSFNYQNLVQALSKKEGELETFRGLLERAKGSLSSGEAALESLHQRVQSQNEKIKSLEKERCTCDKSMVASQVTELSALRRELSDVHGRLTEKDTAYQLKCREVTQLQNQLLEKETGYQNLGRDLDTIAKHLDIDCMESRRGRKQIQVQRILAKLTRLKDNMNSLKVRLAKEARASDTNGKAITSLSGLRRHTVTSTLGNGSSVSSRIPVRRDPNSAEKPELDLQKSDLDLQKQLSELKLRHSELKITLSATEETVHCQTQKMKLYRNMLVDHGLLSKSLSGSELALNNLGISPRENEGRRRSFSAERRTSVDGNRDKTLPARARSLSVDTRRSYKDNSNDTFENLTKEVNKLKQQVDGYRKVLKVFQDRSASSDSSDSDNKSGVKGCDDDTGPISSESATYVLESWLDMLHKFLHDLNESDIDGLPVSTKEVSRLLRGLGQTRRALHTLTVAVQAQQTGDDGRESPDSGCSDYPMSSPNNFPSPTTSETSLSVFGPSEHSICSPEIQPGYVHDGGAVPTLKPRSRSTSARNTSSTPKNVLRVQSKSVTDADDFEFNDSDANFSMDSCYSNLPQDDLLDDRFSPTGDFEVQCDTDSQTRMKALEEIIKTYEEQIRSQSGPNMDSLKHHLLELRHLRIQLEKSMKTNENLERQLSELNKISDSRIQDQNRQIEDLRNQLAQSNDNIREKVKIIKEKERVIKETNASVIKHRDNAARDNTEAEMLRDRAKSQSLELANTNATCDQLSNACTQLRKALQQYKERYEQLEKDNKKHVNAIGKHQNRLKLLENVGHEVEILKARIAELESDCAQFRNNEKRYKALLSQLRSQIDRLTADTDALNDILKKKANELESSNVEKELKDGTIAKQQAELSEKEAFIEKLKLGVNVKESAFDQMEESLEKQKKRTEGLVTVNKRLTSQLDQQKLTCNEYKHQMDKQNQLTKDLKERMEQVRQELSQSIQSREEMNKLVFETQQELQDVTKHRNKYQHHLKVAQKELARCKKSAEVVEKKFNASNAHNATLKVELEVREKLMDGNGDMLTDDDKQNMIAELLHELMSARTQMSTILQQNDSIKRKMIHLIQHKGEMATPEGSETHMLFAVAKIEHFEKLQQETRECVTIVTRLTDRISDRLKEFAALPAIQSTGTEYSTLKELSFSTEHLQVCVNSQLSMIGCFWTSELPAPNEKGEFINQICGRSEPLGCHDDSGLSTSLHEDQLCRSLESTLDVVSRAKHNLQQQQHQQQHHHHHHRKQQQQQKQRRVSFEPNPRKPAQIQRQSLNLSTL